MTHRSKVLVRINAKEKKNDDWCFCMIKRSRPMSYVTQWSFTTDCRSSDKAQGTKPIGLLLDSSPRCLPLGIVHCLRVCGGLGSFRVPFHQYMHCRFRWRWLLTSQPNAHSGVYNTAWCSEIGSLWSLDAPELHTSLTSENQFHCIRLHYTMLQWMFKAQGIFGFCFL